MRHLFKVEKVPFSSENESYAGSSIATGSAPPTAHAQQAV
jgi:hypothetical protein